MWLPWRLRSLTARSEAAAAAGVDGCKRHRALSISAVPKLGVTCPRSSAAKQRTPTVRRIEASPHPTGGAPLDVPKHAEANCETPGMRRFQGGT